MSIIASPTEFHLSFRVTDLEISTVFNAAFLGRSQGSHGAVLDFIVPALRLNLVLLVSDSERPLDTHRLYHLGLGVADKASAIEQCLAQLLA